MTSSRGRKCIAVFCAMILLCCSCFSNDDLFREARTLQRNGNYDEAIVAFKKYLSLPIKEDNLSNRQLSLYTDALVQLMNTYQSKGEPEACISALNEVFNASPTLQKQCLKDYYSVLGYALSRTEKMKEAEETMLKVFTIPLHKATPERYFRDYAYAAAVFYCNPDHRKDVIGWCEDALEQADLCKNTSGKQWVSAMLGSIYKRQGQLSKAIKLFLKSKEEAQERNDDCGVLNSLHAMIDLFLYWDIPEYANIYASEAALLEENMSQENPMISAQTYINKGRALYQLGVSDSVPWYIEQARELCKSLPYNSGMVDVDLLHGTLLTEKGGDSLHWGIQELQQVARQGTDLNRAKAYHQLAQTFLKCEQSKIAEAMLDSMYVLLNRSNTPTYIQIDYKPILNHYLQNKNLEKVELYSQLMLREQNAFNKNRLHFNLVESIVDLQTEQKNQELKIVRLSQTNQRLWFLVCIAISGIIISGIVVLLLYQRKRHIAKMKHADEELAMLVQKLNQSKIEKEMTMQEIKEYLKDKTNRQELETFAPSILKEYGETKFRQCFELLFPLFLHRLREKIPSVTRREELLSMLIALKQDNKEIADLMAIAPRSVLMLRHRFRQKIGMTAKYSLENFIKDIQSPTE